MRYEFSTLLLGLCPESVKKSYSAIVVVDALIRGVKVLMEAIKRIDLAPATQDG